MRERHRHIMRTTAIAVLTAPAVVAADFEAVYDTPDGELRIQYRNEDHMRLAAPGDQPYFLVVSDGDAYLVGEDEDGWYAIDAEQLADMASGSADGPDIRVRPLNETETVAGIRGERYRVEEGDSWSGEWQERGEVVLTDDPRVADARRAFDRLESVFGKVDSELEFIDVDRMELEDQTLLRNDNLVLQSFSDDDLPDRYFQLPPDTRHRDLQAEAANAGQDASDREDSGWLQEQITGTAEDARDTAADETRESVTDSVKEGMESLLE